MSRKAKVIDVEPVRTELARVPGETTKVVKPAETADKTPAGAPSKSTEPSPGYDDGYKSGFNDGHSRAILSFVATVEKT